MRNKIENIPRLLLLAEHLKTKALNKAYVQMELAYSSDDVYLIIGADGKCYNFFPFVLIELPKLFDEWQWNGRGQITYLPDPSIVNNYAVLEFFGLELFPMLHCFSIGQQNTSKYGGFILSRWTQPKDVAENIFRYIESMPCESDDTNMLYTRRVLLEKNNLRHIFSFKKTKVK